MVDYWRGRIAEALRRGSITVAQEGMGYVLAKKALSARYAPKPDLDDGAARVLSPELLTGRLTSNRI
jgi:hypothetical protein